MTLIENERFACYLCDAKLVIRILQDEVRAAERRVAIAEGTHLPRVGRAGNGRSAARV